MITDWSCLETLRCSDTQDVGQDDPVPVGTPQGSVSAGCAVILSDICVMSCFVPPQPLIQLDEMSPHNIADS